MNLTISNESTEEVYGPLEVNGEMTLPDLIALIELECGFDRARHDLYHNVTLLDPDNNGHLSDLGLGNGDLLLIRGKVSTTPADETMRDDSLVEQFRQELVHNQPLRQQLSWQIPDMDRLLEDQRLFRERLGPLILQRMYGFRTESRPSNPFGIPQEEYTRLMSNLDDPANQQRVSELINQQEIDEQMRNALEYTPEMFTSVHMLFINLEINGHPVKAFVDTGAETTIMSTGLAEKTGLARLIDKRFVGEARGVGTGKIIGRIHQAQIKIETQFIPCSFIVLDTEIDLLLGLDMLKRHQAVINLGKDSLSIAGAETKFLGESEIPKIFKAQHPQTQDKSSETAAPAAQRSTASTQPRTMQTHSETSIKQLTDLGFTRSEAIQALNQTNGNAELAASMLFS